MKYLTLIVLVLVMVTIGLLTGCTPTPPTSDDIQQGQQEAILQQGTSAVGMPGIKNFRNRRILKDIQELCDQDGLVTYTYTYSEVTGKYTYLGESIGYGIPYATQYTNPEKIEWKSYGSGNGGAWVTLPQADPDGLFKPATADGTWVMLKNPNGKEVTPAYIEPKISVFTYKLPDRLVQQ